MKKTMETSPKPMLVFIQGRAESKLTTEPDTVDARVPDMVP